MLVVTGLTGAGKSTVLAEVVKKKKVNVVNYGDVMLKMAQKKGIVKSRDEFSNIPGMLVTKHMALQTAAARMIKDSPKSILDTHAILSRQPQGYISGIPPVLLTRIKYDGFVFVDAPSDEVIARRRKDLASGKRMRPIPTQAQVDEDRLFSKILIGYYAGATGAPFWFIQNREGKLNEAVNQFVAILDNLGW